MSGFQYQSVHQCTGNFGVFPHDASWTESLRHRQCGRYPAASLLQNAHFRRGFLNHTKTSICNHVSQQKQDKHMAVGQCSSKTFRQATDVLFSFRSFSIKCMIAIRRCAMYVDSTRSKIKENAWHDCVSLNALSRISLRSNYKTHPSLRLHSSTNLLEQNYQNVNIPKLWRVSALAGSFETYVS